VSQDKDMEAAPETGGDFAPGDWLLLVDERDREFLVAAPGEGQLMRVKGEALGPEAVAGLHDGELLVTPRRRRYLVFRPTLEKIVMNMPREAQVIYPKDLSTLLVWADVAPGMRAAEVGCGHGALTMTLLRALGPEGRLTSFDIRRDHLNRTRKHLVQFLGPEAAERWEPVHADPAVEGLSGGPYQRLLTDVPEPWELIPAAAEGLTRGGVWAAYVPGVTQMARLIEGLNATPDFSLAQGFETLQRFWHVRPPSVRPAHSMKAHTGFIVTCRRRWRPPRPEEASAEA
jgi:tRNA (adenine57-N1/adenine58-N1)-methyltransferase